MEMQQREHEVALQARTHAEAMRQRLADDDARARQRQAEDAQRESHLAQLRRLDVDLSRYLVAQYQSPDKVIRVESADRGAAQLHVHAA